MPEILVGLLRHPGSIDVDRILFETREIPEPGDDQVLLRVRACGVCRTEHKGGVVAINAIHLDRIPQFDYDRLLWGERQIRSVANMTREDARDFLDLAAKIGLTTRVTTFSFTRINDALRAVKHDELDGAAVIVM